LFNDQWVIEEIRDKIKKFLQFNENENTTYQNQWDTKGKFIAMCAYIRRKERFQINDLLLHLKLLEKQAQAKPKTNRRRKIIKIRAKINEIETKKQKKHTKNQPKKKMVL
jgi:hypothetical protein